MKKFFGIFLLIRKYLKKISYCKKYVEIFKEPAVLMTRIIFLSDIYMIQNGKI